MTSPDLEALARCVRQHTKVSYFQMPREERTITFSDVTAFASDDEYKAWSDAGSGALIVAPGLVDLEDSLSVLALMHRLRHLTEVDDRRHFAVDPEATTRQRIAYPGEGWELARYADDYPAQSLVPTVLVQRVGPTKHRQLFLHPGEFEIGYVERWGPKLRRSSGDGADKTEPPETVAFDGIDWALGFDDGQAYHLYTALKRLAWRDDQEWFACHAGEPLRERFVMPGELGLQRGGIREYVEVRRLGGVLWRTLLRDGESPRGIGRGRAAPVPERYAPSRLYPCRANR